MKCLLVVAGCLILSASVAKAAEGYYEAAGSAGATESAFTDTGEPLKTSDMSESDNKLELRHSDAQTIEQEAEKPAAETPARED